MGRSPSTPSSGWERTMRDLWPATWTSCVAGGIIWIQRGNVRAARFVEDDYERVLSVQTYMELLQGARNKEQQEFTKSFLRDFGFQTLPLSENIGHRATVYIETYSLSHELRT